VIKRRMAAATVCVCGLLVFSIEGASGYNRSEAVSYSDQYVYVYNPDYHDYSDHDCANFVSQCLIAGGMSLSAGADGSGLQVDDWGCIPNCADLDQNLRYFQKSEVTCVYYTGFPPDYIEPGDVVIFGTSGEYQHATFVIDVGDYTPGGVYCNAHDNDRLSYPLTCWWGIGTGQWQYAYFYHFPKEVVFCIDDTGSMGEEIDYAKAAANEVLDDNKAAGRERFYTLLTFKDGPATLRGQSSDVGIMKGYINALYADGGDGCPESSLTAIRQAASLSPDSDIFMMTDANSNSYGVDDTYASWGEVFETIFALLKNQCRLHSIIYSTCFSSYYSAYKGDKSQCPGCYYNGIDLFALDGEDPSGEDGYNRASTESGGLYFSIAAADTEKAVEIILREASADSTICFYDGSLSGGNVSYTIPVDETITQLQVVLNAHVGSSVAMEVRNPSGGIVDNATPGVSTISVGGSTSYLISGTALAYGNWIATVSGTGIYRINAEASSTNPMGYTGDTSVAINGTLHLKASVRQEVENIRFEIVNLEGSSPAEVFLYDDGAHGDSAAGDLIYAGTQVMDSVGSYRFRMTGDNHYQRMCSANIKVGYLDVVAPPARNVDPGISFSHQFQVKYLGAETDTYNLFASASLGWADLSGLPASITIPPGGSEYINIPVTVPSDATIGQIERLSLQAVNQTNSLINDTDETETRVIAPTETPTITTTPIPTATPTPTPPPQAEIVLNGSTFKAGDSFQAIFKLNESITQRFTAYAVFFLPDGRMFNAVPLSSKKTPVVKNMAMLPAPFTRMLLSTKLPKNAPKGNYELVVVFFDPKNIHSRADAFLDVSAKFTIQ
jgi:hypothetical protein